MAGALAVELVTPLWAVRAAPGRVFHPGHISERYGLFALIVIGETILAVTVSIRAALAGDDGWAGTVLVGAGGLTLAFALWWLYFDTVGNEGLTRNRAAAFAWGYGHCALYGALAAIGAGVQAQLELNSSADHRLAAASVGVPVAVALLAIAFLQRTANHRVGSVRAQVGDDGRDRGHAHSGVPGSVQPQHASCFGGGGTASTRTPGATPEPVRRQAPVRWVRGHVLINIATAVQV